MDDLFLIIVGFIVDMVLIRELSRLDFYNDFGELSEMKSSVRYYCYFLCLVVLFIHFYVPSKVLDLFDQFPDPLKYGLSTVSLFAIGLFTYIYSEFCRNLLKYEKEKEQVLLSYLDELQQDKVQ